MTSGRLFSFIPGRFREVNRKSSISLCFSARAMGYHKLITYILDTEPGTSLKAAGWKCVGQAGGPRWTGKRRPEVDLCPAQMKIRFEREEGGQHEPKT